MKKIILLLALIQSATLFAQYQVKGSVTDSIGNPLDAAVVILMDAENGNI